MHYPITAYQEQSTEKFVSHSHRFVFAQGGNLGTIRIDKSSKMSLRVFEQIIIIVFVNDTGEDQNNFFQHFLDANSDAKYKHANFYSPPSATLALVGPQNSIKLPFPGF